MKHLLVIRPLAAGQFLFVLPRTGDIVSHLSSIQKSFHQSLFIHQFLSTVHRVQPQHSCIQHDKQNLLKCS